MECQFSAEKIKGHGHSTSKPQEISTLVYVFTYRQPIKCPWLRQQLQTRPNQLLALATRWMAAYHVGSWHQCLFLLLNSLSHVVTMSICSLCDKPTNTLQVFVLNISCIEKMWNSAGGKKFLFCDLGISGPCYFWAKFCGKFCNLICKHIWYVSVCLEISF